MVLYYLKALANKQIPWPPLLLVPLLSPVVLGLLTNQLFPLLLLNLLLRLSLVLQQVLRLQRLLLNRGHLAHLPRQLNH